MTTPALRGAFGLYLGSTRQEPARADTFDILAHHGRQSCRRRDREDNGCAQSERPSCSRASPAFSGDNTLDTPTEWRSLFRTSRTGALHGMSSSMGAARRSVRACSFRRESPAPGGPGGRRLCFCTNGQAPGLLQSRRSRQSSVVGGLRSGTFHETGAHSFRIQDGTCGPSTPSKGPSRAGAAALGRPYLPLPKTWRVTYCHSSSNLQFGGQARDVCASPGTFVCSTGGRHA